MSAITAQHGNVDSHGDVDLVSVVCPEEEREAERRRLGAALDADSILDLAEHLALIAAVVANAKRGEPLTWC